MSGGPDMRHFAQKGRGLGESVSTRAKGRVRQQGLRRRRRCVASVRSVRQTPKRCQYFVRAAGKPGISTINPEAAAYTSPAATPVRLSACGLAVDSRRTPEFTCD